ncbi:MAG: hypothetical protein KatS3mg011_2237 [Acidimicrobiia bacterium]|nr:MAG: hypothetical protein KatS3mg011_2237 [Acidimicrobiia bacterium]
MQRIAEKGSRPAFDPEIFRSRYLQLTRLDRLDTERIATLGRVLARDPQLEAAWRMLQHLYGIHHAPDDDAANQALGAFLDAYGDSPLPEFERIIAALLDWGDDFHVAAVLDHLGLASPDVVDFWGKSTVEERPSSILT